MLTASIVVHNPMQKRWESFVRTLQQNSPELQQVIIIDNASSIEAKNMMKSVLDKYPLPDLHIIENEENVGFGKAHNQALPYVKHPFLAVVNDDIEFISIWSTPMLEKFADSEVGQVSVMPGQCNTLTESGTGRYVGELDEPEYCEGSLFIIRTWVARDVGLFDEIYAPFYCEDSDLSLRLRKLGWKLASVKINWMHYTHETMDRVDAGWVNEARERSHRVFMERWGEYLKTRSLT